jgi:hypothetical protein
MTENFKMLIGQLVDGAYADRDAASIPVPVAVEFDTDEAWQDFQESQMSYYTGGAVSVFSSL